MDDALLNVQELAVLLGKSVPTVYTLIRRGQLPGPRHLSAKASVWLKSEVIDAVKAWPTRSAPRKVA